MRNKRHESATNIAMNSYVILMVLRVGGAGIGKKLLAGELVI